MQRMSSLPKTCVANQATIPPKIIATVPPLSSFKLSRVALQSAGVALLASTALVLAPLDARAGPTITFASPEVKKTLEVGSPLSQEHVFKLVLLIVMMIIC